MRKIATLALTLVLAAAAPQALHLSAHSIQSIQPAAIAGGNASPTDGGTTTRPPAQSGWKSWAS